MCIFVPQPSHSALTRMNHPQLCVSFRVSAHTINFPWRPLYLHLPTFRCSFIIYIFLVCHCVVVFAIPDELEETKLCIPSKSGLCVRILWVIRICASIVFTEWNETVYWNQNFVRCIVYVKSHTEFFTPTRFGTQPMPSSGILVLLNFLVKTSHWWCFADRASLYNLSNQPT